MKKSFKRVFIPVIITAIVLIAVIIVSVFVILKKRNLDIKQVQFVEELQAKAGTYSENTIVLSDTNEHEAKKLAELFGAEMRITKNGRFAVLYLPDDKTILDICSDKANKKYISAIF